MTGAAVLRVRPIPRTEPPVVQLHPEDWSRECPSAFEGAYVQGTLAVDFDPAREDDFFGPQATTARELPDPGPWARQMIRVALEIIDGVRPAAQLSRWVTPDIRDRLSRRGLLARRRRGRPCHPNTVRTVLTCAPADGVVEISAVVTHGGRVRAVAVRMVGVDRRWLITVFDLG